MSRDLTPEELETWKNWCLENLTHLYWSHLLCKIPADYSKK